LQHALATSEEGRECEVQPEKPALGLATPDLVMSRAKVELRGGAGVDSGHDSWWGMTASVASQPGEGRGTARRGGAGIAGMEHRATADVARLDAE
jgi:hypothetical protein